MSTGLDTSVALRLLTGVPAQQADAARAFVASSLSPVAVSDLVVAETYFALRHHYQVPHRDAIQALLAFLSDQQVRPTGVARAVLAEDSTLTSSKSQPGFLDRLVHADYDRQALPVVTFDRGLGRLSGVTLIG